VVLFFIELGSVLLLVEFPRVLLLVKFISFRSVVGWTRLGFYS